MITHPPVLEPPLGLPAQSSIPSSPTTASQTRGSRLRSLSFLRNYAHHLTNRDHHITVTALFPGSNSSAAHQSAASSSGNANSNAIDSSSSSSSPTRSSHSRRISRSMSTPSRSAGLPILSPPERSVPIIQTTNPSPTVASTAGAARLTQATSVPCSGPGHTLGNVAESAIESDIESPVIVSRNPSPAASSTDMPATAQTSSSDTAAAALAAVAAAMGATNPLVPDASGAAPGGASAAQMSTATPPHAEATAGHAAAHESGSTQPTQYSIRLTSYVDPRSNRQSLPFPSVMRKLPIGNEIVKVGRFSERENGAPVPTNVPSAAPVGFKSKVVSRRHCEFWCEDGKWFIKDVKSSSGTFLNHVRLSQPGQESKPWRVKDGDVVQLGIDFRGGEEMIFRCVKMRVEVNRGWQNAANPFNTSAHERIRNLTKPNPSSANSQDCTICLGRIAPCQTLFVAPCSHTWHYKCVKQLIAGPQYPIFVCPNCRATTDLEAEPEEPEGWDDLDDASAPADETHGPNDIDVADAQMPAVDGAVDALSTTTSDVAETHVPATFPLPADDSSSGNDGNEVTMAIRSGSSHIQRDNIPAPVPIPGPRTPSPGTQAAHDLILTPRNNAGPWVFDGAPIDNTAGLAPASAASAAHH